MSEERLTFGDLHRAGFCRKGTRKRVEAAGLDWFEFRRNGILLSDARKIEGVQPMIDDALRLKDVFRG